MKGNMKMCKVNKQWFVILSTLFLFCFNTTSVLAKEYSFSWSANVEQVEGYKLYYKKGGLAGPPFDGIDATEGSSPIDLRKVTSFTISGLLDKTTYHFALTAYDGNDESDYTDVITVFPSEETTVPLTAKISIDSQTGEAPLTVNFDASSSIGSITDYSWGFGDGGSGTGSSTSYTYQNFGTYTAVLTIKESAGLTEQASVVITVSEPPPTDPPVAVMSASVTSGEAPLNVSFNGNGSISVAPPISEYNWSFGDNSTGSGKSVDHVYSLPGSYTAVLTVEDSNGASEEVSTTITVSEEVLPDTPVAVITTSATTGIAPFSVAISGSGSTGSISSYSWNFGDNSAGSGQSVTHIYNEPGNYTITLTVSDSAGQTTQKSAIVVVSDVASAGVSYPFSWSANAEPVEGYKLYYKKGGIADPPFDGTDATEGSSPIDLGKVTSFTISGLLDKTTYHFALTAYDGNDESDYTDVITVFPSEETTVPLTAKISIDSQTGEAPLTVNFDASSSIGSITDYSWGFGDGGSGTGSSTSYTYQNFGTYTAVLTIKESAGLTEQASVVITVSEPPPTDPPVAVMSASVTSGEAPLNVSFNGNGSISVAPPISEYNWSFGDNSTGSGKSVDHVYSLPGSYTAVLTVEDSNGASEEVSTTITVSEVVLPDAPVAVIKASVTTGTAPLNATFSASGSTGSLSSYSWNFGDDSIVSSGQSVAHVYTVPGIYNVVLTVSDTVGQTSQKSVVVVVNDEASMGVSYPFSWSANEEPVTGYKLYYKMGGIAGPPFDGTDAVEGSSPIDLGKVISFTITGLLDNTTYHFALTAYNGSDESDYTDVITVFPSGGTTDTFSAKINVDNTEGEVPLTVVFDASDSNGVVSKYLWNFGDGDNAEGVNVSHVYDSIGTYTATLVASDTNGTFSEESVEIDVAQLAFGDLTPPAAVISTARAEGVVPFTASFNGGDSTCAPDTSIASYEWDFGDGSDTQYGISVEHYFSQAATYTVSLTVTDSAGQTGETVTFVNANSAPAGENTDPIAQFTKSSKSGVVPLYVSFDAFGSTDSDEGRLDYVWSFGDGGTATGELSDHTYTDAGIYTVELFIEDDFGATASMSQTITVLTLEEYEQIKKKRIQVINTIIPLLLLEEN